MWIVSNFIGSFALFSINLLVGCGDRSVDRILISFSMNLLSINIPFHQIWRSKFFLSFGTNRVEHNVVWYEIYCLKPWIFIASCLNITFQKQRSMWKERRIRSLHPYVHAAVNCSVIRCWLLLTYCFQNFFFTVQQRKICSLWLYESRCIQLLSIIWKYDFMGKINV